MALPDFDALPGGISPTRELPWSWSDRQDFIQRGLEELAAGIESDASLLVSIGAPRLRRLGLELGQTWPQPEHRLYDLLSREDSDSAHARYNALVRRLVSFERALECGAA